MPKASGLHWERFAFAVSSWSTAYRQIAYAASFIGHATSDGSNQAFEGVATRHGSTSERGKNAQTTRGVVVFVDGHSEARKDKDINPPANNSLVNVKYWDPELKFDQ